MTGSSNFTPQEFFRLATQMTKELNTHEAELKIRLAKEGIIEQRGNQEERDPV